MKKTLPIAAVALAAMLTLVGCSNTTPTSNNTNAPEETPTSVPVITNLPNAELAETLPMPEGSSTIVIQGQTFTCPEGTKSILITRAESDEVDADGKPVPGAITAAECEVTDTLNDADDAALDDLEGN